ncbi:SH3 domain-containing protein [Oribacterium sp. KHPX15]|uniref:SH3 domain-containing protein n=1 Tax=Oribacterium sp. KHPX15 TaxID=1855342 RepID=UPI00089B394C|nr:SH3 domain-containing protein [Oribacterium sp. KHPX15]SDZ88299.1 SH3 domain-containing protein [Oribacterium sp. KHPX15]
MKKIKLKTKLKKATALFTILGLFVSVPETLAPNSALISHAEQLAVIRGTNVNVRSSAGTDAAVVTSLGNNTQVSIIGQTTGSDGNTWAQISFSGGTGYVRSDFVQAQVSYTNDGNFEAALAQQGFPESYKPGLRQLHAQYPNWVFKAMNTGLDWSTAVQAELQGTSSLIDKGSKSSWKSTEAGKFDWTTSSWPGFDGATWVAASKEIVEYYMDPRNFLDDSYIFQFTAHEFDPSVQTLDRLKSMVKGTFLEGSVTIDSSSPLYQTALQSMGYTDMTGTADPVTGSSYESGPVTVEAGSILDLVNSGLNADEVLIGYDAPGSTTETQAASESTASESTAALNSSASSDETVINITDGGAVTSTADNASDSTTAVSDAGSAYTAPGEAITAGGAVTVDVAANPAGAGNITGTYTGAVTVTYSDIIMEAAEQAQISPYVLASMIIQEQGSKGTSGSISGATGYYNYFNVGAYATGGMTAVERGLWYASQSGSYNRPWNTPERAIVGGAMFYASNYLNAGQNTLYLKRFNVQGSNIYKHQYMTNTQGAAEEGKNLSKAYNDAMRQDAITFYIPVYSNMPETACPMPTKDGNPNNKLASLSVDGFTLTPGFNMDTASYTLIVDPSVTAVNVSAAAIHSGATISGAGQVALDQASTIVNVLVTAENGDQLNYQITINKSAGGQTNAYQTFMPQDPYSNVQVAGYAYPTLGSTNGPVTVDVSSAYNNASVQAVVTETASNSSSTNMVEVGVGPM